MLELLDKLAGFLADPRNPQACAVATIIGAAGSVPRPLGTSMLVSESGDVAGSLSGGCVEGAVFETCRHALATGTVCRENFGYSDEDAFAVGLTCGGTLSVLIQPIYPGGHFALQLLDALRLLDAGTLARPAVDTGGSAALIRRIDNDVVSAILLPDPAVVGAAGLPPGFQAELVAMLDGSEPLAHSARTQVTALLRQGQTGLVRLAPGDGCPDDGGKHSDRPVQLLVETRLPPPRLFIFGANDFSAALIGAAKVLDYHVTLCDARPVFANRSNFPAVDDLVIEWPEKYLRHAVDAGLVDGRSAVCVLTHDAKFDVPLLETALGLDLAYVGAMGSRRSDLQRRQLLLERGVTAAQLAKLRSPIGLDLGAVTPKEVAVSIIAEMVALSHGRERVLPLSCAGGPIHGEHQLQVQQ